MPKFLSVEERQERFSSVKKIIEMLENDKTSNFGLAPWEFQKEIKMLNRIYINKILSALKYIGAVQQVRMNKFMYYKGPNNVNLVEKEKDSKLLKFEAVKKIIEMLENDYTTINGITTKEIAIEIEERLDSSLIVKILMTLKSVGVIQVIQIDQFTYYKGPKNLHDFYEIKYPNVRKELQERDEIGKFKKIE